jgi:hypothetical protein
MIRPGPFLLGCCALLAAAPLWAAPPTPAEMAKNVDKRIEAAWKKAAVEPAAPASDAEFVRRAYLDLVGRVPTVSEVRKFLADKRSDRRARLIEKLLESPRFVTHQMTVWRGLLLPEANANFAVRFQVPTFERWLINWLESGKGVDAMFEELITQPVNAQRGFPIGGARSSATPFYAAKDYAPEELAGAVARLALGVNLSCAQCHNHPFADWKREQFWSFAAFFAGIKRVRQGDFTGVEGDKEDAHEITIPNTDKKVKAKFLDGKQPAIKPGTKAREVLAKWVVSKDNPYFARALVNRIWAHFFGTGIVEPLDEMTGTDTKPSHPELLDELAKGFADNKFDLRWLIRSITSTRAYQLSSRRTSAAQDDPHLFARAQLRGLTPEQLYDSLATATGYQEGQRGGGYAKFGLQSARGDFVTKFANSADRPTEVQTSILQALAMMNGQLTSEATSLEGSETLAAIADAPFLSTSEKVEALYLAALSRKPTSKELGRLTRYVDKGGESKAKDESKRQSEALADVFWALLNSAEFKFNH